ncbi:hypothetical protein EVAR_63482_1 [Eumeta japonica]|uniref:Uncharacterized protein n=1 Tax=Eumeta variegata TaxID=151549 RepID=A0A4C2A8H9_EUMVA|nr:hypothetical protein EVAR_63482_1 [Eumeta japonica]
MLDVGCSLEAKVDVGVPKGDDSTPDEILCLMNELEFHPFIISSLPSNILFLTKRPITSQDSTGIAGLQEPYNLVVHRLSLLIAGSSAYTSMATPRASSAISPNAEDQRRVTRLTT